MVKQKLTLNFPQPPAPVFVKLKVLQNLRIGDVFYIAGDDIEVFHREALALMEAYPDHFQEVQPS